MSVVETARLLLRPWQDDDLERLVALYGDPRVARFLSVDGHPWPRERSVGAFEHFRRQWQEHSFGPWAAIDRRTGGWLGQIGLNELPLEKCGLVLQEEFNHKGALVAWYAIDRADWQASQ
jgi:RimJ/RimL family protein N-acetyltransferase